MQQEEQQFYEFGPFVLDTVQHVLFKDRQALVLTPKTYDALLVLVKNSGRMLSKEDLMRAVWPDSFVEESNLTQQISTIRKVLGESPGEDLYIVTVAGRGYRFSAKVRAWSEENARGNIVQSAGIKLVPAPEAVRSSGQTRGNTDGDEDASAAAGHLPGKSWRNGIIALLLVLTVMLAAVVYPRYRKQAGTRQFSQGPRRLAILPFRNLRHDPSNEFLGFSLADAVITKLGYVSALTVRPSSSIEKYRDQAIDIQKVSGELNVDTLLASTFIREGDDLRITSQLIDVKTEKLLWKGAIDLKLREASDRAGQCCAADCQRAGVESFSD